MPLLLLTLLLLPLLLLPLLLAWLACCALFNSAAQRSAAVALSSYMHSPPWMLPSSAPARGAGCAGCGGPQPEPADHGQWGRAGAA